MSTYCVVKNQHVFPRRALLRFCAERPEMVDFRLLKHRKSFPAHVDDRNFVANRKWDEQIERDAVQIEDTFHSVAEAVCHGAEISLDSQRRAIQRFYVILRERSIAKKHTFTETSLLAADQSLNRVEKVDLDRFESQGIFMGGAGQLDRVARGLAQRLGLLQTRRQLHVPAWRVVRSDSLEFLVSDQYHMAARIPVGPFCYLEQGVAGRLLSRDEVRAVNLRTLESADLFVFARNLQACGVSFEE